MRRYHFPGVQGDRGGDHLEEEQEVSKAPENTQRMFSSLWFLRELNFKVGAIFI